MVWNENPIYPVIKLIQEGSDNYTNVLLNIGEEFNIKVGEKRLCIGTEANAGKWITCASNQRKKNGGEGVTSYHDKIIDSNYIQCSTCRITNYFSCRMTCTGVVCDPSSAMAKAKCDPPDTSVYLTHVGGELKVGVSLGVTRRWLEQGSDYSTVITKTTGLNARKIEQILAKKFSLKLQVRNTKKLRNLKPIKHEYGFEEISYKLKEIKPLMRELTNETEENQLISNTIDLTKYYGNLNFDRNVEEINIEPGIEFGGVVVAVKGSFIIVQNGIYYYALDTKKLISNTFELLDRPAIVKKEQAGLDEWF